MFVYDTHVMYGVYVCMICVVYIFVCLCVMYSVYVCMVYALYRVYVYMICVI